MYLDLKALDKIPLKRLLGKLGNRGTLNGKMKNWMKNHLKGREMRTVVKDIKSEWRNVCSGVPQGLVLALVLLLAFISDMPQKVNSYMSLFADDANI